MTNLRADELKSPFLKMRMFFAGLGDVFMAIYVHVDAERSICEKKMREIARVEVHVAHASHMRVC